MNNPETFFCICCETTLPVSWRQENGLCGSCTDMLKRWKEQETWTPSWSLIFFLGLVLLIVEAINREGG
jgi:hypothetical protein